MVTSTPGPAKFETTLGGSMDDHHRCHHLPRSHNGLAIRQCGLSGRPLGEGLQCHGKSSIGRLLSPGTHNLGNICMGNCQAPQTASRGPTKWNSSPTPHHQRRHPHPGRGHRGHRVHRLLFDPGDVQTRRLRNQTEIGVRHPGETRRCRPRYLQQRGITLQRPRNQLISFLSFLSILPILPILPRTVAAQFGIPSQCSTTIQPSLVLGGYTPIQQRLLQTLKSCHN